MSEYLVVYEKAGSDWSAYVPDLPGCITTGETQEECRESIKEAIDLYLAASREIGSPIPKLTSRADYVRVA